MPVLVGLNSADSCHDEGDSDIVAVVGAGESKIIFFFVTLCVAYLIKLEIQCSKRFFTSAACLEHESGGSSFLPYGRDVVRRGGLVQ